MSKVIKKALPIASIALPVMFPGIGSALGAGLGMTGATAGIAGNALLGAGLSGATGGLKGALMGGLTGGLAGGGAEALAGAAGLTGTGANIAKGALVGASAGGQTGGGGGALMGALTGGLGAGLSELGGMAGAEEALSSAPITEVSSSGLPYTTTAQIQSGGMSSLADGAGLAGGGGISSMGNLKDALSLGSTLYSGMSSQDTIDDIRKQMLAATGKAETALSPFTTAGAGAITQLSDALKQGFNPSDLASDAGYQFQLSQGQDALTKRLNASGLGDSGAAVKAATEYSQGLAGQTFNDAFNRWLQQNNQLSGLGGIGANATGTLANLYGTAGGINAGATLAGSNAMSKMISGLSENELFKKALLAGGGIFA